GVGDRCPAAARERLADAADHRDRGALRRRAARRDPGADDDRVGRRRRRRAAAVYRGAETGDPARDAARHRRRRAHPAPAAAGAIPRMFDLDLLSERARVTPDRLALVSIETGERLTYADLNARAERTAATLRTLLDPG